MAYHATMSLNHGLPPFMLAGYRIDYGAVVVLFLANLLATNYYGTVPLHTSVLIAAGRVCLVALPVVLVAFSRLKPSILWGIVLAWEALFLWYAWFSPAAPFVLHETPAAKPNAIASERMAHQVQAGALFIGLFLWFLSLGVVRSLKVISPRGKNWR